jgi:hypothetical protein
MQSLLLTPRTKQKEWATIQTIARNNNFLQNFLQKKKSSIPLRLADSYLRNTICQMNPSTPELNPSAQLCLTTFITVDFAS